MDVFLSNEEESEMNRRIFLISLVCLCVALVIVFTFSIYILFCVLARQSRSRGFINLLSLTMAHNVDHHHHHAEPTNTGLDPALIMALPTFIVLKNMEAYGGSMMECAVCLSALEHDEIAKLIPSCNHIFHVGCIDSWLALSSTCPLCRVRVQPWLKPQLHEGPIALALDGASLVMPVLEPTEGTSDGVGGESPKISGLNSPLSSFRRILGRERSPRIQAYSPADVDQDLERQ
ncbi:RING-H2 finger protein ATL40-like [Gastrolobium bilobum]|uniref:RING-H2 finger protein ATL40-like n=1 Tax=Gastrolobium bilobum TaxID=150636 RepID=UPI002AB22E0F|nr:RING-H2 finger protein ATL40-like [Gastrolobium bilobum]